MTNFKKAKKTMDALVRAGHPWATVIDRVVSGFRLTAEEKESIRLEYAVKEEKERQT